MNTVPFNRRYVDSLKFLDIEKHNIYILLKALSIPASLPRHSLLMTINYVTRAIDVSYLTCRFTNIELKIFLSKTVIYLDSKILEFQDRCGSKTITDLSGTTWTLREYYQRIYIQLLITFSDLLAKTVSEKFAVQFMERRKSIVDVLSDEKSPRAPHFRSSNQQYESHKPANSDKPPTFQFSSSEQHESHKPANFDKPPKFQSSNSQQHELYKKQYVHVAADSDKPPSNFQPSSQSDRVHAPDSVPLSTKAQRQSFYTNLGNRYLALGQHSKVAECQLKLMEDLKKCEQEKCSYKEIGYMYWSISNFENAAKFLELSLEYDANNLISEAQILIKLFLIYNKIREWPWTSEDEQRTLSRMISLCHKLTEKNDKVIFYNWKTILTMITLVNKVSGINVDSLEEKMFTIISTPNTEFQLKPKDALEVIEVVEQANNYTKTVLWGSLLLQPFENYNNFSVEEKVNVLRIYLSTSKAKIKLWHFTEGLNGMEHVYKMIEQSLELQDHDDTNEMNRTVCFYLIVRLKYVIPCYRGNLKKTTSGIFRLISSSMLNLPTNLAYIVFVVPFEFSTKIESSNNGAEVKPLRPSTAVTSTDSKMFGVQIVEDIVFTVVNDFKYMVQSAWYNYISTFCSSSWSRLVHFCLFCINVITVAIRLWVLCAFFAFLITVSLILCSVVLEAILAPLYMSAALSPTLPQSAREVFIALCDLLIFLSKVQIQLLQNQVGFPWLGHYIRFSQLNLAQLYPFDYDYHLSVYEHKINNNFFFIAFSLSFIPGALVINLNIFLLRLCYKRKFVVFFVLVAAIILYLLL